MGGPSSIYFIYIFGGRIRNSEAATSGGGAQRPVWRVNEPEKTGARSALARTRGQNPLVPNNYCRLREHCDNPCCDASTCRLWANATCGTGECCDFKTCRPQAAGVACRHAEHECDLPEFCTGESEFCPADIYKVCVCVCMYYIEIFCRLRF